MPLSIVVLVDAAGQDDKELTDRQDAEDGHLPRQVDAAAWMSSFLLSGVELVGGDGSEGRSGRTRFSDVRVRWSRGQVLVTPRLHAAVGGTSRENGVCGPRTWMIALVLSACCTYLRLVLIGRINAAGTSPANGSRYRGITA